MKKLLLFVMLAGFLAVNAQHPSKDFWAKSPHYVYAKDGKCDIIPVEGWNLSKTIVLREEQRGIITVNPYDGKYDIIPVEGWNLSKTIVLHEEQREIITVNPYDRKYDIIPVEGWNLTKTIVLQVEHR